MVREEDGEWDILSMSVLTWGILLTSTSMMPLRVIACGGKSSVAGGTNWFLVLPNIYGVRPNPDGHEWIRFEGLAIRITNGVSIVSWDGRDIRHCTSLSEPDGPPVVVVGGGLAR